MLFPSATLFRSGRRFRAVALAGPLAPRGARQSRRLHRNSGAARLVRTISVKCAMPPRARENRGPGSIATTSSRRFLPPHDRLGIGLFAEAFEPALDAHARLGRKRRVVGKSWAGRVDPGGGRASK